jgi:hypothetical protein
MGYCWQCWLLHCRGAWYSRTSFREYCRTKSCICCSHSPRTLTNNRDGSTRLGLVGFWWQADAHTKHLKKKKGEGDEKEPEPLNPAWVPNGTHLYGYKGTTSVVNNPAVLRHAVFRSSTAPDAATTTARSTARSTAR